MSRGTPSSRWRTARTSSRVRTTGRYGGRLGRTTSSSHGSSTPRTSRYRNSSPLKAWFWVDAATFPSTARDVRNSRSSVGAHLDWVALAMKDDVSLDPMNVRLLGTMAVVAGGGGGAGPGGKAGAAGRGRGGWPGRPAGAPPHLI